MIINRASWHGISVSGSQFGLVTTKITGCFIETNSSGTTDLGNDVNGILIFNSANTEIGLAGNNTARNIIVRNDLNGIFLNGLDSDDNVIQNNFIGTIPAGTALGNFGDGILITGGGSNTIGGTTANAGNTIGLNIGNGVNISSSFSSGNLIRHNLMYANDGLGINLGAIGVTPNDTNDADTGANNLQNFPVLQNANPTRIVGTLNSLANQIFTLDFYRTDSCDPSGNGEGRFYLASTNVTTVGNNAAFNFAFSGLTVGQIVTATATDANGNTSEFSQCRTVTPETGDFQLSAATFNFNENTGAATITVNRVGGTNSTITVDYATSNGTAIAGTDFTTISGTLTFLNGETSKTISVPIINDTMDEPNETFNVALSNPTGGALLLAPSSAIVTITDDDNPPTVSINDISLAEGNSGTTNFIFTISLSQPSGFNVSVNYATANGTATAGIDYASTGGTVNFSSALAETSKTVTVAVTGELTVEINETFFVDLSNPTSATIADSQGVGTITDDDNPGRMQFSQSPYSGSEGSNVLITVTRTNGAAGTVSVDYATGGGNAAPNVDYTPASATLMFNDGETSKNFPVAILSDLENEVLETFNIVLSNPIGGATLGALSTTTVNIASPSAATAAVSGRVSAANGRGVSKALITLTGANGETRTAMSNPFGYYRFADVEAGRSYVMSVRHKQYQFTTRVITVNEDLDEENFIAEQLFGR